MARSHPTKASEPLFGPNIGPCSLGPEWTRTAGAKPLVTDELTREVLYGWVEKSRATATATTMTTTTTTTTTLHALVNLKRPSLRLSPLATAQDHALEFEYDCDAPKCAVHVHVVLPNAHPDLLFQSVLPGGFNKRLSLDDGPILELDRYHLPPAATPNQPPVSPRPHRFHLTHRSLTGPALPVLDDDSKLSKDHDDGVRLMITLAALDDQATELASPNQQTTFLHVLRLGPTPVEPSDNRPWVVKVVKREATIGPHTFQLHEIYGLASSAQIQPPYHTYPPQAPGPEQDDPSSECLLCLSSPRQVVLIPCRHLVACRECALNMVEFGAGGQIVQPQQPTVPPPAVVVDSNPESNPEGTDLTSPPPPLQTPNTPTTPATTNIRRKRKAKGWFCPVCRQPYTSLLRITTAPPPPPSPPQQQKQQEQQVDKEQEPNSIEEMQQAGSSGHHSTQQHGNNNESNEKSGNGLLGGTFNIRPGFLRGFTSSLRNTSVVPSTDVESRAGLGRVGA